MRTNNTAAKGPSSDGRGGTAISKAALWQYRKMVLRGFFKKKLAVAGMGITLLMILVAVLAPLIAGHDPYEMVVAERLQPPGAGHIFGTDTLGRDLFSRVVYGTRVSMEVGLETAAISFVAGMVLGLLAGYFSFCDNIIMRICESMMSIPPILMAIALMAAMGATTTNVVISLAVVYTPTIARIARAAAMTVREQTYIEAIRSEGASWFRILFRHIAPNVLSPVLVQATYIFATSIIIEAALSFLGAGVPAPDPSLGNILYDAKGVIFRSWWMTVFPGIFMVLTVLGLNVFGDSLRDLLDPLSN